MARSITLGILALSLASGCTLDLARLSSGGATDGGDTDAGERDAGEPGDAGDDAGAPDGGCGCVGAGWQSTPFVVGGTGVSDVRVADLDGDGDGDIVASVRGTGVGASLLRLAVTGCGRLGLTSDPAEPLASAPADVIVGVADWDGDGVRDILAPDPGAAVLRVLRGNVSGGRYSASRVGDVFTRAGSFAAFALGLGRDGDDVIVLGDGGGTIAAAPTDMARAPVDFRLTSTGSRVAFQSTTAGFIGAVAEGPAGIELVRFVPDAAAPIENLSVLPVPAGANVVDVHFVDLDDDGVAELVAVDVARSVLLVYRGSATDVFGSAIEIEGRARVAVTSGMLEPGTSAVAVIALSEAGNAVELLSWSGSTLVATSEISLEAPTAIAVADVDQDSQLDLVIGHSVGGVGRVSVLRRVCP